MRLTQLVLDGKGFSRLSPEEQTFLVLAGQLSNDLTILHKLVTVSFREPKNELEHKANAVLVAVLLKTLAAKIYQGWEVVRTAFDGAKVGKAQWLRANDQLQRRLESARTYFAKDNIIETIRNRFAAHYDTEPIAAALPATLPQQGFEMLYGGTVANGFYVTSEIVTWSAILGTTDDTDFGKAMKRLVDEVAAKSGEFLALLNDVAEAFCTHVVTDLGGRLEECGHAVVATVAPREVVLPLFLASGADTTASE